MVLERAEEGEVNALEGKVQKVKLSEKPRNIDTASVGEAEKAVNKGDGKDGDTCEGGGEAGAAPAGLERARSLYQGKLYLEAVQEAELLLPHCHTDRVRAEVGNVKTIAL